MHAVSTLENSQIGQGDFLQAGRRSRRGELSRLSIPFLMGRDPGLDLAGVPQNVIADARPRRNFLAA